MKYLLSFFVVVLLGCHYTPPQTSIDPFIPPDELEVRIKSLEDRLTKDPSNTETMFSYAQLLYKKVLNLVFIHDIERGWILSTIYERHELKQVNTKIDSLLAILIKIDTTNIKYYGSSPNRVGDF